LETKRFTVERCGACKGRHELIVTYNPLYFPTVGFPPEATSVSVEYKCSRNSKQARTSVRFDAPVEVVYAVIQGAPPAAR